ncbi:transcriptional regulator, IclR family [Desulfuromonas soudanensis]|uniref:Transcriptional regulator, IclR family n=1 Tax=Desulfuromonas soudanensis TaxID=1603606 RepID=A0A0M4DES4_9BACT|nr:IclR family transcriptional regulator [Desulfuromonas soudanensis]ALC15112.1 transcriptional regulator, IclR family [Desulfuromonas soudanensis]
MEHRAKESYAIQSVDNALSLLEAMGDERGDFALTDLSTRLGLNKSSVFRLLATFEGRGYVETVEESKTYRLASSAFEIGRKLLLRNDLLQQARPVMERLARECGESIYLAVRRGGEVLFLHMVDSGQKVTVMSLVGHRYPLEGNAPGRLFLALGRESLSGDGLEVIRRQGYAVDRDGLGVGIDALAAPLGGVAGDLSGALCLIAPAFRLGDERLEKELLERLVAGGRMVEARLGWRRR